jgi:metal-responsive CopG/Arc/MetJ family transcriptional regulator
MNTKQLSITINKNNLQFLEEIAKRENKPRSEVINIILTEYQKYKLKKEIQAGFKKQNKTDFEDAILGFSDYLSLIDENV